LVLDRLGEKTRKVVKRRAILRQVWRKNTESCQKKSNLKTGLEEKHEKLSEPEATSDKIRRMAEKTIHTSIIIFSQPY
jgi:hypothetical protein